jgi:cyanate lyase
VGDDCRQDRRPAGLDGRGAVGQTPGPGRESHRRGGTAVAESLRQQPTRTPDDAAASDPTIYRFHEAIDVYGPALKELIHEEFGDGIMSAINFKIGFERRSDPNGDRVVVTFDGKFLDYNW